MFIGPSNVQLVFIFYPSSIDIYLVLGTHEQQLASIVETRNGVGEARRTPSSSIPIAARSPITSFTLFPHDLIPPFSFVACRSPPKSRLLFCVAFCGNCQTSAQRTEPPSPAWVSRPWVS